MAISDDLHGQALGMATKCVIEHLMRLFEEKDILEKSELAKIFAEAKSELENYHTTAGTTGANVVDFMARSVLKLG
jgi:hypothetical protein